MGSGRGQSRRAQAIGAALPSPGQPEDFELSLPVRMQTVPWDEFVRSNGLEEVKVYHYYLGSTPDEITEEVYEKLLSNLFADAAAVGALTLPSPYRPEDFELSFPATSVAAEIRLKGDPERKGTFDYVNYYLWPDKVMSSEEVRHNLLLMAKGLLALFSA